MLGRKAPSPGWHPYLKKFLPNLRSPVTVIGVLPQPAVARAGPTLQHNLGWWPELSLCWRNVVDTGNL